MLTCVRFPAVDTHNEFFWAHCHWVCLFIKVNASVTVIMIRCKFFFLFIGREPTTWPANNCLQIMVCSCAMSSNCAWLQIIFCPCVNETTLFSFLRSLLRENGSFPKIFIKKQTPWLNYKTIMISHAWHNFPFPCSWNQIQGLHRTALSLARFQKCKRSHSLCGFPEFKPSLQAPDCRLSQWSSFWQFP